MELKDDVSPNPPTNEASIIDMGDMDDLAFVEQSYDNSSLSGDGRLSPTYGQTADDTRQRRGGGQDDPDWREGMAKSATSYLLLQGKERAQKAITTYANVDYLRPYFDVEPQTVLQRLMHSFIPINPFVKNVPPPSLTNELYGPTMLVFTLVAVLLFEMKMSAHAVSEGTLMGSALTTAFLYWFGAASTVMSLSYICNSLVRPMQILSLVGYSLTGHCIVLFLGTVIHTAHDHLLFYLLWALFGGLTAAKMVTVIMSRTAGHRERMIMSGVIVTIHLLFLLYLHFAYHQVVEEVANVFRSEDTLVLGHHPTADKLPNLDMGKVPDLADKPKPLGGVQDLNVRDVMGEEAVNKQADSAAKLAENVVKKVATTVKIGLKTT